MIIGLKINVSNIDKNRLFKGEKGTYLDITLLENREGPDKYGNDFIVVQDVTKEEREKGVKGPILGNGKFRTGKPAAAAPARGPAPAPSAAPAFKKDEPDDDSIPF